ncbi:MAG: PEGA domain-containing protein [Myxococcota bacterium]
MRNRLWGSWFFGLGLGLLLWGCPKQVPTSELGEADAGVAEISVPDKAPPTAAPTGPGLVLTVEPNDAELLIDGTSYGPVSQLQTENGKLALKPGIYQVALKRAGYTSWRAEVTVTEKPEPLQVSLVKQ